jgi:hypothetical protein
MTSKMITLKVLDGVFIAFALALLLAIVGFPLDLLLDLMGMSARDFEGFALFVLFGLLWLIYEIAASDSAP